MSVLVMLVGVFGLLLAYIVGDSLMSRMTRKSGFELAGMGEGMMRGEMGLPIHKASIDLSKSGDGEDKKAVIDLTKPDVEETSKKEESMGSEIAEDILSGALDVVDTVSIVGSAASNVSDNGVHNSTGSMWDCDCPDCDGIDCDCSP